ncbi:MAG: hypothetical protein ACE1ZH_00895 [Gammaproteobacteria bacterium]
MNPPGKTTPSRYTDRTFPPYRFIPGKAPHPTRDPDGHSYNKPLEKLEPFEVDQWQSGTILTIVSYTINLLDIFSKTNSRAYLLVES